MSASINFPEGFVPGYTDNFYTNEVIVKGLTVDQVWPYLVTPSKWHTYNPNSSNEKVYDQPEGAKLELNSRFFFDILGLPIDGVITDYAAPSKNSPARISWTAWSGEGDARFDAFHGWLLETLEDGRLRILTQETQNGTLAKKLAGTRPNPVLNGNQLWLEELAAAASKSL